jgi:hypothetical protein
MLEAKIADDGLPVPARLQTAWTVVDGPGVVAFTDSQSRFTKATFSAAGLYTLRVAVSDGELTAQDELRVTVDANPNIRPDISCESAVVELVGPRSRPLPCSAARSASPRSTHPMGASASW